LKLLLIVLGSKTLLVFKHVFFRKPDALVLTQPVVSEHWNNMQIYILHTVT